VNQARNDDGATPLSISSQNGHQEVVKMLKAGIATVRRLAVLSSICQVRLRPPTPPPSQLLSLLANRTPDDLVRVILEFLGAEAAEEATDYKDERLELKRRKNAELEREVAELDIENDALKAADAEKSSENAAQREEIAAQREEIAALREEITLLKRTQDGGDGEGSAKRRR